jgi:hypothetical protein
MSLFVVFVAVANAIVPMHEAAMVFVLLFLTLFLTVRRWLWTE